MDKIAEGLSLIFQGFSEAFRLLAESVTKLMNSITIRLSSDPKIKKCLMISERTKNRRIKKKQLTKIAKRLNEVRE